MVREVRLKYRIIQMRMKCVKKIEKFIENPPSIEVIRKKKTKIRRATANFSKIRNSNFSGVPLPWTDTGRYRADRMGISAIQDRRV